MRESLVIMDDPMGLPDLDKLRPIWRIVEIKCASCKAPGVALLSARQEGKILPCSMCGRSKAIQMEVLTPRDLPYAETRRIWDEADRKAQRDQAFHAGAPRPQRPAPSCYHFRKKVRRRGRELAVVCADCLEPM